MTDEINRDRPLFGDSGHGGNRSLAIGHDAFYGRTVQRARGENCAGDQAWDE
jgi:hypothetical protein